MATSQDRQFLQGPDRTRPTEVVVSAWGTEVARLAMQGDTHAADVIQAVTHLMTPASDVVASHLDRGLGGFTSKQARPTSRPGCRVGVGYRPCRRSIDMTPQTPTSRVNRHEWMTTVTT